MRALAGRVWIAVAYAALGVGVVNAGDAKPATKEQADDAAWLPPITAYRVDWRESIPLPPSVFPNLVVTPLKWDKKEDVGEFQKRREVSFDKLCPRLLGNAALRIEPTDDPLRKLLKARAHQLVLEYQEEQRPRDIGGPDQHVSAREATHLLEIRSVLAELYAGQPRELIPWLEELVVASKVFEWYARLCVEAGALKPQKMGSVVRVRLQLELALWSAKNPDAEPVKKQPAKKTEPAPVGGNWLADKKVPPSLFPDIVPPALEKSDWDRHWLSLAIIQRVMRYAALCPRLFGTIALKVEPTDDVARKLLKARLHQGTLQFQLTQRQEIYGGSDPNDFILDASCLLDMQAAATELWGGQPKELVPWLEELLVAAKDQEPSTQQRAEAFAVKPQRLNYATQVRLKIEAELWKAKNAK